MKEAKFWFRRRADMLACKKGWAIINDRGIITRRHCSRIAPCIIGTKIATKVLKTAIWWKWMRARGGEILVKAEERETTERIREREDDSNVQHYCSVVLWRSCGELE